MAFSYWESNAWLERGRFAGGRRRHRWPLRRAARALPAPRLANCRRGCRSAGRGRVFAERGVLMLGSATELRSDRQTLGDEAALELVRKRWQGLQRLRSTFGDNALGHRVCGSVELFPGEGIEAPPSASELEDLNRWIQPVTGVADTFIPTSKFPAASTRRRPRPCHPLPTRRPAGHRQNEPCVPIQGARQWH